MNLQVRGQDLTVATTEQGEGPDLVVYLHGLGCARDSFNDVIASIPTNLRSIAFDFPGHGDTLAVGWHNDLVEYLAETCAALVERSECQTVHLVGHSLGGAVAVLAAGLLEGRVRIGSVISVEGNLTASDCGIASRRIAEANVADFVAVGIFQFVAELRGSPATSQRAWAEWMARADPLAVHRAAVSLVAWSDSGGLAERWQRLDRAVYLWGEQMGFPEHLRHVLSDHQRIPGSGHFPQVDAPAALAQAITAAVNGSDTGRT
jgi:pimeloyl-ACP methyl ester carboxylesterase